MVDLLFLPNSKSTNLNINAQTKAGMHYHIKIKVKAKMMGFFFVAHTKGIDMRDPFVGILSISLVCGI